VILAIQLVLQLDSKMLSSTRQLLENLKKENIVLERCKDDVLIYMIKIGNTFLPGISVPIRAPVHIIAVQYSQLSTSEYKDSSIRSEPYQREYRKTQWK